MVKSVAFLWPIFSEEAVAQGIIAHHILDLQDQDRNFTQHPPVLVPKYSFNGYETKLNYTGPT